MSGVDRMNPSADVLSTLSAYLPSDLTESQADKIMVAMEYVVARVWAEAMRAQSIKAAIRSEYRLNDKRTAADEAIRNSSTERES